MAMDVTLRQLRAYLAVLEAASFSEAARAMHFSANNRLSCARIPTEVSPAGKPANILEAFLDIIGMCHGPWRECTGKRRRRPHFCLQKTEIVEAGPFSLADKLCQ